MTLIKHLANNHLVNRSLSHAGLFSIQHLQQVRHFHNSLPGYTPTPLIQLTALSKKLGLSKLFVKDESQRFELNAFKMLGASFAIASFLAKKLSLNDGYFTFEQIVKLKEQYQTTVFATATDGNHGRAVAWSAKLFGCQSKIYMPKGSSLSRLNAIKAFSPDAQITELDYDDTVKYVEQQSNINHWQLIQDTAWPGYTDIPDNIMRGYFSLLSEFEQQAADEWPTHVFLQAGVGSMAAAITDYLVAHSKPTPKIILVEPFNAPCFYESIKIGDGLPHKIGNLTTIMAGLACGMPSLTAWEILKNHCHSFITCADQMTINGMKQYAFPEGDDPAIKSGESAAVTLGVLQAIMTDVSFNAIKADLNLNSRSKVLLLSTEGDTDPEFYQSVISEHR